MDNNSSDLNPNEKNESGFVFVFFDMLIEGSKYLSLVELFKIVFLKIAKMLNGNERKYKNYAIDVFMMFKWILVLCLWHFSISSIIAVVFVAYLLIFNLQSYFYYHIWDFEQQRYRDLTPIRQRRRFVALLLAFCFSIVGFAYLYAVPFGAEFECTENSYLNMSALIYSIGNAFTGYVGTFKPLTNTASILISSQLVMSFIFLTIVLTQSLPQIERKINDKK